MTRRDFELLVGQAIHLIPAEFLERIDNLTFQIDDWADAETLDEVGFDDPRDLLGYYRGWPLSERTHEYSSLPDVITIYQKAVENYQVETGVPLTTIIAETVIHELAHYFGFTEEEMDAIEEEWAQSRAEVGDRSSDS